MTPAEAVVSEPEPDAVPEAGFRRSLGLYDSTMVVVGGMIGSGIFLVRADMARQLGARAGCWRPGSLTGVLDARRGACPTANSRR